MKRYSLDEIGYSLDEMGCALDEIDAHRVASDIGCRVSPVQLAWTA